MHFCDPVGKSLRSKKKRHKIFKRKQNSLLQNSTQTKDAERVDIIALRGQLKMYFPGK